MVETSQFDSDASDEALDDLVRQIRAMGPGTQYYVPEDETVKNARVLLSCPEWSGSRKPAKG